MLAYFWLAASCVKSLPFSKRTLLLLLLVPLVLVGLSTLLGLGFVVPGARGMEKSWSR